MLRQTLALALMAILAAPAARAADLPVKKVVLYKHGIGFFRRAGRLPAGETARLDFKAAEMNDVLKSLTIEERGGGRVRSVRYDSSEPAERKLREFPFTLEGALPLAAVLNQLKGSRLDMRFGADKLEGVIVGGRATVASERQPEKQEVILLLDSGDLRTLDLLAASALRLVDPRLQAQFQEYLETLAHSRSREKRAVTIESSGAGPRDLIADYVIPMAAWKSSYRLVLDSGPQPLLEGWAIVDNTTGDDWSNISLSLVSGLPVSFVSRLYEPRWVRRPEAELPQEQAQRPVLHAAAVEENKRDDRFRAGAAGPRRSNLALAPAAPPVAQEAAANLLVDREQEKELGRLELASSLAHTAAGRELGDLFQYSLDHPVTIRKNESAMLPFLQQPVQGRRLLIFSESHGSQHPLSAVEITNSTGKTLDGGAVTVLETGGYAGESLMETLKAGDKRLLSYAVDLGTRVTTAFDTHSNLLREFRLRRGVLTTRTALREVKTFTIRNVDSRAKTLVIETPVRPEYKLVGVTAAETTARANRFEVKLVAGATEKFPLTEERVVENAIAVSSMGHDALFLFVQDRNLDEARRKKLEPLVALKGQLAAVESELRLTEKRIQELFQDQGRIRSNISSLSQVSGQQQRVQEYAQRLAAQESELATLRDRQSEQEKRKTDLTRQIEGTIQTLEI